MKLTRVTVVALAAITLMVSTRTASARSFTSLSDVQHCVPTAQGVWVATNGGMARVSYSGRVLGSWTKLDGLPGTRISTIVADGTKLIVGGEAGVAVTELVNGKLTVQRRISGANVRSLTRYKNVVYAGTWGKGVMRVDLVHNRLRSVAFAGGRTKFRKRVTTLAVHDNKLLAGTAGSGVFTMTPNGILVPRTDISKTALVWSLMSDGRDLLVGSVDGLHRVTASGTRLLHNADTRALARDGQRIVAASFGSGIRSVLSARTRRLRGAPAKAVFGQAVSVTSHGACVGGKTGLWLRRKSATSWQAARLGGLPANDISTIAADGARLWIGMFDHGVAVMENGVARAVGAGVIDPHVNSIAIEKPGTAQAKVWIATANGLFTVRGKHIVSYKMRDGMPSRMVFSVNALARGGVVAGTPAGAVVIRGKGRPQVVTNKHAVLGNVWAVAEDADGFLWMGTTRGVYRGKVGAKRWQRYTVSTGDLKDDWVMAIATHGRTVFVGTYKGGVARFQLGARKLRATQLGGGWINPSGLRVANGRLYAATMDGPREHTGLVWRVPVRKTLGKDTTLVLPTTKGLWVASRRGLLLKAGFRAKPAVRVPHLTTRF